VRTADGEANCECYRLSTEIPLPTALRRRCVGSGAPVNLGRRQRAANPQKIGGCVAWAGIFAGEVI